MCLGIGKGTGSYSSGNSVDWTQGQAVWPQQGLEVCCDVSGLESDSHIGLAQRMCDQG